MDNARKNFTWEPLTPRGVAAFASASVGRLLLVQIIVAFLVAASIAWFLDDGCFPRIRAAIQNLPAAGEIHSGKLNGQNETPKLLAEGRVLAFDVDLHHSGQIHSTADVQIEFGLKTVRVFSLLGYAEFPYLPDRTAPFNRTELEPLWGAWAVETLFIVAVMSLAGLLVCWWLLATLYFLLVWLLGFYANRDLDFRASWKLSGAALLPGALLMAVAIFFYDFGALGLVQFGFVFGAHFVLGWVYLFVSLLFLPRISSTSTRGNPFVPRN